MSISNEVFNRISDVKEKQALISLLVAHRLKFFIKAEGEENDRITSAMVTGVLPQKKLTIEVTLKDFNRSGSTVAILQAVLEDKKIIGQVRIQQVKDNIYELEFTADLYQIQRREHFRLRIPPSFYAYFEWKFEGRKLRIKILDLSAGGVLLVDEKIPPGIIVGQKIEGTLVIPGKEPRRLECEVKRSTGQVERELGLKFLDFGVDEQREMMAIVMDLYRRFHQRPEI